MKVLLVGAAGFAGAVSRYLIGIWIGHRSTSSFPWATLLINVSGCFALGLLMTVFADRWVPNADVRAALTVGFLGAYTTFSTFAYDSLKLGEDASAGLATANVVVSVAAGIAAAWLGTVVGRAL